jgi:hypothetical protein
MTMSNIIWQLNICTIYTFNPFLTTSYQRISEYWQRQDSTKSLQAQNGIGWYCQIIIIIGRNKKTSFVKMCFCRTSHQRLKFSIWVQHIDESCPRLSTQVVFTAAFLKIPRTYLSCSCLLSLVRECANCCGVVCPRKLFWKRELYRSRGDNNGLSLFSALSCIESWR